MCDKLNLSFNISPYADLICISHKSVIVSLQHSDWLRAQYGTSTAFSQFKTGTFSRPDDISSATMKTGKLNMPSSVD